jgi:hypothetical protein
VVPLKDKQAKVTPERATKSRRGLAQYQTNPFVSTGLVEAKTRRITNKNGDMMVFGKDTGALVAEVAGFWHSEEVDNAKFVKLYVNGVKAFRDLTGSGTKVFELLYLEVQKNIGKDTIWLSFNEVDQTATPMAKTTFMRGMRELIEKGFLAESTTPSKYFLNPDYMWNGDRLAFVKAYHRTPSNQLSLPMTQPNEGQ